MFLIFAYFLNSFLGLLEDRSAVLDQSHASFVLLQAVLQGNLALLYLADDVRKLFDCLFKAQFADIIFWLLACHLFSLIEFLQNWS